MEGSVTRVGVGEKAMAVVAHKARKRSADFCIFLSSSWRPRHRKFVSVRKNFSRCQRGHQISRLGALRLEGRGMGTGMGAEETPSLTYEMNKV